MTITINDIPLGYTFDSNDKILSYRNTRGFWQKYTRDSNGKVLTFEDNTGYFYDSNCTPLHCSYIKRDLK